MSRTIHPVYKSLIKLLIITSSVYLSFKYLLPLIWPFIIACILVKMASPFMVFLRDKCHIPQKFASLVSVLLLSALIIGIFSLIIVKMYNQFQLFCSNYHKYHQFLCNNMSVFLDNISRRIDSIFRFNNGTSLSFLLENLQMIENAVIDKIYDNAGSYLTKLFSFIAKFIVFLFIIFISMIIYVKDRACINEQYGNSIIYKPVHTILHTLKTSGLAYIKAQLVIIACNWIVCSTSFLIIHNPYFILLGFIISVVDALPILGSGIFFTPLGIYYIIAGNYFYAAIMFTSYVITLFVREILEARLIGASMDILPFFILASVYIGLNVFGVSGIILGPFALILIKTLYQMDFNGLTCKKDMSSI